MKLTAGILFVFFLFCSAVSAKPLTEKRDGALWVKSVTTAEAEEIFKTYHFESFNQTEMKFPRIYFLKMPKDWKDIPDSDDKHRIFIRIILPLVLKVNEDVLKERAEIETLQKKFAESGKLEKKELEFLEEKAKKYDAFTRFKGERRVTILLTQLLERIDAVPPSLLTATAGIYSNWGTSRLALQANSLYLTEVWYDTKGLKPLDDENADYRYKIFASLEDCIAAQALKINSHVNYFYFRESRKEARKIDRPLYGSQWAATMTADSNLKNIAGLIDYTFTYYELQKTDYKSGLEDIK